MRRWIILSTALFFLSFSACGNKSDAGGISGEDARLITGTQVSNFLVVLPTVLDYASEYQSRLSEAEKNSSDANDLYFRSLKKSEKVKAACLVNQFKNIDDFLSVYKNVVLAYTTIKKDLTNYQSDFSQLKELVNQKGTPSDKIRVENIETVKNFESQIDALTQSNGN
jgi:hypothetical protein